MTDAFMSTRLVSSPTSVLAAISTAEALDAAFAGEPCEIVLADGRSLPLATDRWRGRASDSDVALFVDPCSGPTLDLGCGPGRLAGALQDRGVDVLGVDISSEAVRQTRARGARALCRDVFADLPRASSWAHVLLADGNIGLGGRPQLLLRRVAALLAPTGSALVELAKDGAVSIQEGAHLRVGERRSRSFDWASVGVEAIEAVAAEAGLVVVELTHLAGRHVATLRHSQAASAP